MDVHRKMLLARPLDHLVRYHRPLLGFPLGQVPPAPAGLSSYLSTMCIFYSTGKCDDNFGEKYDKGHRWSTGVRDHDR